MITEIPNLVKENSRSSLVTKNIKKDFVNEYVKVKFKDYYFSNVIARSSKTMHDCNNAKQEIAAPFANDQSGCRHDGGCVGAGLYGIVTVKSGG